MNKEIKVFAPATVSNIGCGFDVMGFAIDQPGDELVLRIKDEPGVTIAKITGDGGKLPLDACKNTAGKPIMAMVEHLGFKGGIEMEVHKKMPLGSGLGSSAASAVAAAFAMNELLEAGLSKKELLPFALEGEKLASGSVHADNVAPCLWGGFVLIRGYDPIDVVSIPVPDHFYCTVIHPHTEIQTKQARQILPKEIPLKNAVAQWGNTAGLVAGLLMNDFGLISRSIHDLVAEPVRAQLIPRFYQMKKAALNSGALGCSISGSGPSLFALSTSEEIAVRVAGSMKNVLDQIKLSNDIFISKVNITGPKVLSKI